MTVKELKEELDRWDGTHHRNMTDRASKTEVAFLAWVVIALLWCALAAYFHLDNRVTKLEKVKQEQR